MNDYYSIDDVMNTLYHHGILGQKWGVRRYQNKDGTLTAKGKKRISKEYKQYHDKGVDEIASKATAHYVEAYNRAADRANSGLIDEYNKQYFKKHGKNVDPINDPDYEENFNNMIEKVISQEYTRQMINAATSNENMRKAKELCEKYKMTEWDDTARKFEEGRKLAEQEVNTILDLFGDETLNRKYHK